MQTPRLAQLLTAGAIVLIAAIVRRRMKQHMPPAAHAEPDNVTVRQCDDCGKFSWPGADQCTHCGPEVDARSA